MITGSMKRHKLIWVFFACCSCMKLCGQKLTTKSKDPYVDVPPHHLTLLDPCPKFFELEYRSLPSAVNLLAVDNPVSLQDLDRQNRLISSKLMFPILIKKRTKLIGQLGYNQERLNPWQIDDPEMAQHPFVMKQGVLNLILQHKMERDRFLIMYVRSSLNSNEFNFNNFFDKYSYMSGFILGKTNERGTKMGIGLVAGQSLGRFRIAPTLLLEKQYGRRWFLNVTLPKEVNMKYALSSKTYISTGVSVESGNYLLQTSVFDGFDQVEFRRTSVNLNLGVEHYLNEWLGINFYGGMAQPLNNVFVEPGEGNNNPIFDTGQPIRPFFSAMFFAMIPRKFLKKAK